MSPLRRIHLADCLAESRIVVRMGAIPLVKALLQLAELVVRDGFVKDPLGFYGDLSSQVPAPIARVGEGNGSYGLCVYQVCSAGVRKMAAAMALSPEGVCLKRGHSARIVVLVASPEGPMPPNLALPARAVSLLGGEPVRRERLLACAGPAEILALIGEFERLSETPAQAR